MTDERHKWRRSEWISISTLLMVGGWIWWASAKATVWDGDIERGRDPKKGFDALDTRVTIIETTDAERWRQVVEWMAKIDKKVGR